MKPQGKHNRTIHYIYDYQRNKVAQIINKLYNNVYSCLFTDLMNK